MIHFFFFLYIKKNCPANETWCYMNAVLFIYKRVLFFLTTAVIFQTRMFQLNESNISVICSVQVDISASAYVFD